MLRSCTTPENKLPVFPSTEPNAALRKYCGPHGTHIAISTGLTLQVCMKQTPSCDPFDEFHIAINMKCVWPECRNFGGETPLHLESRVKCVALPAVVDLKVTPLKKISKPLTAFKLNFGHKTRIDHTVDNVNYVKPNMDGFSLFHSFLSLDFLWVILRIS
jgi:hypothetical protein